MENIVHMRFKQDAGATDKRVDQVSTISRIYAGTGPYNSHVVVSANIL